MAYTRRTPHTAHRTPHINTYRLLVCNGVRHRSILDPICCQLRRLECAVKLIQHPFVFHNLLDGGISFPVRSKLWPDFSNKLFITIIIKRFKNKIIIGRGKGADQHLHVTVVERLRAIVCRRKARRNMPHTIHSNKDPLPIRNSNKCDLMCPRSSNMATTNDVTAFVDEKMFWSDSGPYLSPRLRVLFVALSWFVPHKSTTFIPETYAQH